MTRFLLTLRRVVACFLIGFGSPALAQQFELSLEQGRVAARQAALMGQFELARDFALALTDADANDRLALIVLAAVQPKLGASREGRRAGARAFRLSQSDDERYEAARLTALAAANEERYTLSQIWLRRAAVNAPDDAARVQTRTDYRAIRNLNPWSVRLGFSITPSSNVNGGADSEFNIVDGVNFADGTPLVGLLSGAARALPGTVVVGDVRLTYALSRSATQRTSLGARGYVRAVFLNDEAQTIAPNVRNSDFRSENLEFSVDHARRLGDGSLSAQAAVGASWFGQERYRNYMRARLGYALPIADRARLSVNGDFEKIDVIGNADRTDYRRGINSTLLYVTEAGDRISTTLNISELTSILPNVRSDTVTAQVSYAWADPFGPVQLSAGLGVSLVDYDDYLTLTPVNGFVRVPGGRSDTRVFATLSAAFPDIDYAGFIPVVTLGAQDTRSNVSRFERDEFSLNIGIRSSF